MNKIGVFDLDLTFLRVNSFKLWVIFTLIFMLFDLYRIINFLVLFFNRIFGRIDRYSFKKKLLYLQCSSTYWSAVAYLFSKFLTIFINPTVLSHTAKYNYLILATAAPALYVRFLFERLKTFDHFIATDIVEGSYRELLAENKKIEVSNFLTGKNITSGPYLLYLYTDSLEDLPLAEYVNFLYVVNDDKTVINNFIKKIQNMEVLTK